MEELQEGDRVAVTDDEHELFAKLGTVKSVEGCGFKINVELDGGEEWPLFPHQLQKLP